MEDEEAEREEAEDDGAPGTDFDKSARITGFHSKETISLSRSTSLRTKSGGGGTPTIPRLVICANRASMERWRGR